MGVTARRARSIRGGVVVLTAAAVLAGCGEATGPAPSEGAGATGEEVVEGIPGCSEETISADSSVYRETPRYGNADTVIEAVRPWAQAQPGFEELWLDREHNGWITLGFSEGDVTALQEEAEQEFPDEGVAVVAVPHSRQELDALQEQVVAAMEAEDASWAGIGSDVARGRVSVDLGFATPEAESVLAQFSGEPLCVDARPADEMVPEGPQPTAGESWRLLGEQDGAGEPYRTGIATTPEQLESLWAESGLAGGIPEVDFESEIAIWFGAVYGSGCPVRMDDVVAAEGTVHGQFVLPGSTGACNDDANAHAYVVALDRGALPEGPFRVQLDADDPPQGAPEERTEVGVDLSAAGATATQEEIDADPGLGEQEPAVEDGGTVREGEAAAYRWVVDPDCGLQVLGTFNGTRWRLADGTPANAEMEALAAEGELEVTLYLVDDFTLIASHAVTELTYVPAEDGFGC
ncbi:MAG: hypothetical protein M3520_00010 [Actinomycetota bacterium]|nr:hypothetical protein [Actinomycetota bacterium]